MPEHSNNNDPYRIEQPDLPDTPSHPPVCVTCNYDLSGTDPGSPCPECGLPASLSYPPGPFAAVNTETLRAIRKGFTLAFTACVLYVIIVVLNTAGSIYINIAHFQIVQPGQPYTFNRTQVIFGLITNLLNTGAVLLLVYGCWKITSPITEIPPGLTRDSTRRTTRVTLVLQAIGTILSFLFGVYNAVTILTGSSTWLQSGTFQTSDIVILIILAVLGIAVLANMIVLWIQHMLYLKHIARLTLDQAMFARAKHLIWSGPIMVIIGSMCFMIGPIIFAILYTRLHLLLGRNFANIIAQRERAHPS